MKSGKIIILCFIAFLCFCVFVYNVQNKKKQPWLYRVDKYVYKYLREMGVDSGYVEVGNNGLMLLNLEKSNIDDIRILNGLPLDALNLSKTKIYDITPLTNFNFLKSLNISGTTVSDLNAINNIPLRRLDISHTQVTDLKPIRNMPLECLSIVNTPVTDIEVLLTMQIQELNFSPERFTDAQLKKLQKIKFKTINMQHNNASFWKDWESKTGQYEKKSPLMNR